MWCYLKKIGAESETSLTGDSGDCTGGVTV